MRLKIKKVISQQESRIQLNNNVSLEQAREIQDICDNIFYKKPKKCAKLGKSPKINYYKHNYDRKSNIIIF